MSIEDGSMDALKEEGTTAVIDGSDYEWSTHQHTRLYSMNEDGGAKGHYLYVDENGSLKADGGENSASTFTVYTLSEDDDLVMLKVEDSEDATEKVVAVDTNTDTVIVKALPSGTLGKLNNSKKAKSSQSDILFYKKARKPGSPQFYLKSYLKSSLKDSIGVDRIVGFDHDGVPIKTTDVQQGLLESLFKIY
ncbi:uncharacterized protein [Pocillopora verrucosa]|uniref:uncharacterized protein n=1 Tax=Pocillopora verrucosa TaxID=203993 RepID=UPI0033412798